MYERSVLLPPSSAMGSAKLAVEGVRASQAYYCTIAEGKNFCEIISPNGQSGAPVHDCKIHRLSPSPASQPSLHGSCAIWGHSSLECLYDAAVCLPTHRHPRFTDSPGTSHPLHSRPEPGNLQKTVLTTTLRYSSMRHPIPNTRHTRASRRMTSNSTRNRQHASKCSCAILSRTRCTTPIMGIFHSRQPFSHPRGTPSVSARCTTRHSFRMRLRGGIRRMVRMRRDQADRFGIRPQNCSRYVLHLTSHLSMPLILARA
jgi:hypothetical protein